MTPAARLRAHVPEYLAEAAGLGLFMIAASLFASLLEHPASPVRQTLGDPILRRLLMGLAMGATAVALIYSPIGARSGAHINPATTFTFWRLGRLHGADAAAYIAAQFAGAGAGMLASASLFRAWIDAPQVHYVATVPGPWGQLAAFGAEVLITFVMMSTVLRVSNHATLSRYTGLFAGGLVALYITVEAPVSGMSLNPARSFAPALLAAETDSLWIYFGAPPLGMLLAAEAYVRTRGLDAVFCAKLHHHTAARCIFHCRFDELSSASARGLGPRASTCGREPVSVVRSP
jgi:aquaporin Z